MNRRIIRIIRESFGLARTFVNHGVRFSLGILRSMLAADARPRWPINAFESRSMEESAFAESVLILGKVNRRLLAQVLDLIRR